jgi:uncharacterized protein YydD (DUF2326 family)
MIISVQANKQSFRTVEFQPGFNIVLADRTKESTRKDSRNGLGKTTLIEIVHFCLGSSADRLRVPQLRDWAFTMTLTLGGRKIRVTRSVAEHRMVFLQGDTSGWPIEPEAVSGKPALGVDDWTKVLGALTFDLPINKPGNYRPSFRSMISYFVRRTSDAFSTPFEHYRKQHDWDRQVNVAYLLGLSWEDARDLKLLAEREKTLNQLKKASKEGLVEGFAGTIGELEADRIRLEKSLSEQRAALSEFRVLPEYRTIESEADALTHRLHELGDKSRSDRRVLEMYRQSLREEASPEIDDVLRLYQEAKVQLPDAVTRRLEEVRRFHGTIVANRRSFVDEEIRRLERAISERSKTSEQIEARRAELFAVLNAHRALDEYQALQQRAIKTEAQARDVESRIGNLKRFREGQSALRVEREETQVRARRDYDELHARRERAITLFNENSEALYAAPGRLAIDVVDSGFQFNVAIERSGSHGIDNMKVFCFDLMLAQLWSKHQPAPGFLIHDSALFDGVDERQKALALERAAAESRACGFQYICSMNSDAVPARDFSEGFSLDPYVRLRLTDASPEKCLLGFRF